MKHTHLKVKFTVVEPDSERYISFEDDVHVTKVRDFFDRCGIAVEQLFNLKGGPQVVVMEPGNMNKIAAIKLVRAATQLGLKEAKDVVEAPGGRLFVIEDGRDARVWQNRFDADGVKVRIEPADLQELLLKGVPTAGPVVP